MDNRILTQLTPRSKQILSPRHRKAHGKQFRQAEHTITILLAAAELLSAQNETKASGELQAIATRLLLKNDRIMSRAA